MANTIIALSKVPGDCLVQVRLYATGPHDEIQIVINEGIGAPIPSPIPLGPLTTAYSIVRQSDGSLIPGGSGILPAGSNVVLQISCRMVQVLMGDYNVVAGPPIRKSSRGIMYRKVR